MVEAIRSLWDGDDACVLRCKACGFGFGDPFVAGDARFYSILHEQHGYPAWRWDYDLATSNVDEKGQALDIGAGRGFFLKGLPTGWGLHAVESTPEMACFLKADAITVFDELENVPDAEFDLVTMFQVLEHIANFRSTLAHCARVLRPGGLLVITVPDADAMFLQERLTGAPDAPPNHIAKWTPAALTRVLAEQGLAAQPAIFEKPSWQQASSKMHLRVSAAALREGSVAAWANSIRNRRIRRPILAAVGLAVSMPMLGNLRTLRQGGAFGIVASNNSRDTILDF